MTTIVAVKKNGKIGIGSDNLMVYGTCKENYYLKNSIFENSLLDLFFHFIMIWKQQIFEINWNRNIINHKKFAAVGSGYSYALGSMYSTYHFKNIKDILEDGLYAASNFDAGTQKPFFISLVP